MTFFPEMTSLEQLLEKLPAHLGHYETLCHVPLNGKTLPIYGIVLGSKVPSAPTLGLFGGVHGLERIGTQVILAYLQSLVELLGWDSSLNLLLSKVRIVSIPLLNPAGMLLQRRSNLKGVDLMRNAPTQADGAPSWFLPAGHRISSWLPWYRGKPSVGMQPEARALIKFSKKYLLPSQRVISVDVHSGFGMVDRLWFPYAKTVKPFSNLPEAFALKSLFDQTYVNHIYQFEPQSRQYLIHGDLWDYVYDLYQRRKARGGHRVFIPLALEMGSWLWVKKNPRQLLSVLGVFNPIKPHRQQRILRRHLILFDFLLRVIQSPEKWAHLSQDQRQYFRQQAMTLWYDQDE
jgi:hypothetical protein